MKKQTRPLDLFKTLPPELKVDIAEAAWRNSYDGWAIIGGQGTILDANKQFFTICRITPAQIIGKTFQEITSKEYLEVDVANAEMVKEGRITYYELEIKQYDFITHKVNVGLKVDRLPTDGTFMFYLARIMEVESLSESAELSEPTFFKKFWEKNEGKIWAGAGVAIAAGVLYAIEEIMKK